MKKPICIGQKKCGNWELNTLISSCKYRSNNNGRQPEPGYLCNHEKGPEPKEQNEKTR